MPQLTSVDDYIKNNLVHSLHTSESKSFRGCRRRWSWIFRDFYYPTVTAKPLEFGVAFHKAMEALYDPDTWNDREVAFSIAKVVFKKTVEAQRKAFEINHGPLDPEVAADYTGRVVLGLGMLTYYYQKVLPVYDWGQFTPVRVEIKFEVPITSPQGEQLWCKCDVCWRRYVSFHKANPTKPTWPEGSIGVKIVDEEYKGSHWKMWRGLPVTYGGRLDCLAQDQDGRYWIIDWKTAAQLTRDETGNYLLTEDQITRYCWALWLLGIDVAGFIYAEIKKAVPSEPEPLKRPYKGRLYSCNKQKAYDKDLFVKTVSEGDPGAYHDGLYDEFIEYLETEGATLFHARHQVHRNEEELRNAGLAVWQEATEMLNPDLQIYPNAGRFNCGGCAFIEPCLGTNRGEDVQYYLDSMFDKRIRHYYEDAPASTDKRRD
jgi:hypothetical protein